MMTEKEIALELIKLVPRPSNTDAKKVSDDYLLILKALEDKESKDTETSRSSYANYDN